MASTIPAPAEQWRPRLRRSYGAGQWTWWILSTRPPWATIILLWCQLWTLQSYDIGFTGCIETRMHQSLEQSHVQGSRQQCPCQENLTATWMNWWTVLLECHCKECSRYWSHKTCNLGNTVPQRVNIQKRDSHPAHWIQTGAFSSKSHSWGMDPEQKRKQGDHNPPLTNTDLLERCVTLSISNAN